MLSESPMRALEQLVRDCLKVGADAHQPMGLYDNRTL